MNNPYTLLQRAEEQFLRKDYTNALKIYGLLLNDDPKLKEAKVGAFLSDLGMDSDADAQALFDYYQVIKDTNTDADKVISDLMQMIYTTRVVVQQVFGNHNNSVGFEDGISYDEFVGLVEQRGDFVEVFEDVLFSTKVIIDKREEFIDFMHRLIDAQYYDMVLGYLDTLANNPAYDQDLYQLYLRIPKDQ